MPRITVENGIEINCEVDDYLWPWEHPTPVLMQHGFSRNASFWRRWIPHLTQTRRVYRTEVRGCGNSTVPDPGFELNADLIINDIRKVIDELGLEKVHWVGESSGGFLGILFAAAFPERVASLVLMNTPVRISVPASRTADPEKGDFYSLGTESPAAAIAKFGLEEWSRRTLSQALDLDHASPELQDFYVTEKGKTPPHVAVTYLGAVQSEDTLPLLRGLKVPVLLMGGDKKRNTVENQKTMMREIPNADLKVFPGYGQAIHVLLPERCAAEAIAFWERFDPTVAAR